MLDAASRETLASFRCKLLGALIASGLLALLSEAPVASFFRIMQGFALVGGVLAIIRSAGQIEGMAIYHGATRLTTIQTASRWDPGSYRIRMRLAEGYANRGDCGRAVPHARAANGMFPNAADPKSVLRRCGIRVR